MIKLNKLNIDMSTLRFVMQNDLLVACWSDTLDKSGRCKDLELPLFFKLSDVLNIISKFINDNVQGVEDD